MGGGHLQSRGPRRDKKAGDKKAGGQTTIVIWDAESTMRTRGSGSDRTGRDGECAGCSTASVLGLYVSTGPRTYFFISIRFLSPRHSLSRLSTLSLAKTLLLASSPPSHLSFNIWYLLHARPVLGPEDTGDRLGLGGVYNWGDKRH